MDILKSLNEVVSLIEENLKENGILPGKKPTEAEVAFTGKTPLTYAADYVAKIPFDVVKWGRVKGERSMIWVRFKNKTIRDKFIGR